MKVLVELDTDNIAHAAMLRQLLNGSPPADPLHQTVVPSPAAIAAPVVQPAPLPAPQPAATVTPLAIDTREVAASSMWEAHKEALRKDPAQTAAICESMRAKYGLESNNWSEEAFKEGSSRLQALLTL